MGVETIPTYNFRNKVTGEEWTSEQMTIADMERTLRENKDLDVLPAATPYGDAWRMGVLRPSDGMNDLLKDIKRRNRGSTIQTR